MKKKSIFLGLPLALFALTACEDEPEEFLIWDFTCYSMEMEVSDEAGNDLLDPANADNILGDSIRVLYNGEIYSLDTASITTRFNMPQPLALRYYQDYDTHKYRLAFGEFTPEDDFKNESFTLDWGDGTTDEISFDCYITWKDQDPTVHKKLFLNGEEIGMDFTYLLKFVK